MAVVMLLCFTGCGNKGTTATTGTSNQSTTDTATTSSTTAKTSLETTKKSKTTKSKKTTATTAATTGCVHASVSEATCTEKGECKICGAVLEKALGHSFIDGVCTRCGEKSPEYMSRVEVLGISLEDGPVTILVGDVVTLSYSLTPENATDQKVTWTSSNPSVVAVQPNGELKGVSVGDATITVTSVNGKTDSCKVLVRDVAITLPQLPMELRYPADYKETVAIYLELTKVETLYTQTSKDSGTLILLFGGWLTYATDGNGDFTTAKVGWRLFDSEDAVVAEGVAQGSQLLAVGNDIAGVSAEITDLPPGRYRLEVYDTI